MRYTPMARDFGARLHDVDLTRSADSGQVEALMRLLYRYRFLVAEDQPFDEDSYAAFGRRWGELILFFDPRLRDHAHPELIVIHNRPDTLQEARNVALHWHVDGSYEDPAASTTMLFAVEGPEDGNETLFCDMVAAYAALSPEMKARIEDLVVIHGVGDERLLLEGEHRGRGELANSRPAVHHRLAGERMLYAPSGSPRGIVGMEEQAAIDLLLTLKRHAVQPYFRTAAAARTGSLLIWDNHAVMHSATPTRYSDADGERRMIYRISTRAIPQLAARRTTEGTTRHEGATIVRPQRSIRAGCGRIGRDRLRYRAGPGRNGRVRHDRRAQVRPAGRGGGAAARGGVRIRDKIADSKARGMWMGGTPPLGYRPDGRSLALEAKVHRHALDAAGEHRGRHRRKVIGAEVPAQLIVEFHHRAIMDD